VTAWRSWDARQARLGPIHQRVDGPDGRKAITWRLAGGGYGLGGHRLEDLVYAERIPFPPRVVVTEGERAADAVRRAGFAAVGTVCGASSTPGPAVIDLFTGVDATLWPDADQVGFDHMARLAARLEPVVAALRLVDLPGGTPTGWDAADATVDEVGRLVCSARDIWLRRAS
jgi:hypothetical protein